jgi:DNA-directed RNA polymerase beta' subunit
MASEADRRIPFVQSRIPDPAVTDRRNGAPLGDTVNLLHRLLFQPIAGDAMAGQEASAEGLSPAMALRDIRFGILDAEAIEELAVVTITNPATTEGLSGGLSDQRMGAIGGRGQACHTCGQQHHNCPGHMGRILLPYPVMNPLFVPLVVSVLQTLCVNCHRLRVSPYYINFLFRGKGRQIQRLRAVALLCGRITHCQFCYARTLTFKQQGLCITARPTGSHGPPVLVPAAAMFAALVQIPDEDLAAIGIGNTAISHPCNAVMVVLPVLPPVSRPAMRTMVRVRSHISAAGPGVRTSRPATPSSSRTR